jgi:hypothetical protein
VIQDLLTESEGVEGVNSSHELDVNKFLMSLSLLGITQIKKWVA